MATKATGDRRAQNVAALGFLLQLAAFAALLAISIWSHSDAIQAVARFMAAGLPIWVVLFLVFKQIRRVKAEELETEELRRAQESGITNAIFEVGAEDLLVERQRVHWLVKWFLPATTILVALYLLVGSFVSWGWTFEEAFEADAVRHTDNPTMMMWFAVGVGFLCFLYARYAIALTRIREWELLHAGAAGMAANALVCLGLVFALMAGTTLDWPEPLLAYLVRVAMIVLGIELVANFIFDFYRPRIPGEIPRPSFDSRLFGLVSRPGGIAKSIAEAINYQFGFEVSSTWFYQLLQRWMFPLVVLTMIVILAMSSVVIVDADEQAVVERLGRLSENGEGDGVLEPGLHFKWPWPVDVVYRAPVKRVSELVIGEARGEESGEDKRKAIIWTEAHDYVPELLLLVASSPVGNVHVGERGMFGLTPSSSKLDSVPSSMAEGSSSAEGMSRSVGSSLLLVSVPVEYCIKDLKKYLYRYDDPVKLMEGVAYQFLSDFAASVEIDELMGPGREAFNGELQDRLQKRLDELDVGIEVVFVGVRGAHPPAKANVAESFQAVISSQIGKESLINAAQAERQKILTDLAGSVDLAVVLDEAIKRRDRVAGDDQTDSEQLTQANQEVNDLLLGNGELGIAPMSGRAAALISEAKAKSSEWVSRRAAVTRSFQADLAGYQASPELYRHRKKLECYLDLDAVRKYLIVGDPTNVIIEYETTKEAGLDRVLEEGIEDRLKN